MATPGEWFQTIPPITRIWATSCVATTVLSGMKFISLNSIYLSFTLVFKKFQLWRLITPFFYIDRFGFRFVMNLVFILSYSAPLEKITYEHRTADYAFMLLFGMASLLPLAYLTSMYFTAIPLIFMALYVWSRYNPDANVSIWGVLKLKAFYLPWALLGLGFLLGHNPMNDLAGILVGHLYYFLHVLHPRRTGKAILVTPQWLRKALSDAGIGEVDPQFARPTQGFRAFQGGGRRLAD
mmetsp:Transcript_2133/g.7591  ORF Transcript_2133/g.7591 Transcript_2133/m.7591 type:complete len:238 (+) Transcript_2133:120-833(+)